MDSMIEGEQGDTGNAADAGDKPNLDLPGKQQELLEAVCRAGKPVILVIGCGSALAVNYADAHCGAILQAWYPGSHGGEALADILLGKVSPSGKLPVTFYKSADDLPDFTDYSMKNRTYRYFTGEALYPFGYGLTYSSVALSNLEAPEKGAKGENLTVHVGIENTGSFDIEEVVQCYIQHRDSQWAALHPSLCAFKRIALNKGEKKEVALNIAPLAFTVVDDNGNRTAEPGLFDIYVGIGQPDARSEKLQGVKPLHFTYHVV